jgi:hypothetical protein
MLTFLKKVPVVGAVFVDLLVLLLLLYGCEVLIDPGRY